MLALDDAEIDAPGCYVDTVASDISDWGGLRIPKSRDVSEQLGWYNNLRTWERKNERLENTARSSGQSDDISAGI